MAVPPFDPILEEAQLRHGSEALAALPAPASEAELRARPDDRYLSAMSQRIFRAGLKHSLVDAKWPAFEEVFHGFEPSWCAGLADERIEELLADRRLVRHLGKLRAVRHNAAAMLDIARRHGGFGNWLADWPVSDIVGLWEDLARRFSQLGGNSAPYFLRMVGKDTFIPTDAVLRGLRLFAGFEGGAGSRADRRAMQEIFGAWQAATGRPLCQLSRILAMAVD